MKTWKVIALAALALVTPAFAMENNEALDPEGIMQIARFKCYPPTLKKEADPIVRTNILLAFQIYDYDEKNGDWGKPVGEKPQFDAKGAWVPTNANLYTMVIRHETFRGKEYNRTNQYGEKDDNINPTSLHVKTIYPSFTWHGVRNKSHRQEMHGILLYNNRGWNYEEFLQKGSHQELHTKSRCELDTSSDTG